MYYRQHCIAWNIISSLSPLRSLVLPLLLVQEVEFCGCVYIYIYICVCVCVCVI
jgi:hypothetical protein